MNDSLPVAPDQPVLSTLNKDGTRRWLRPRLSVGSFLTWRKIVGYALIVLFTALPWMRVGGRPAMLFDLARREFIFFGHTFLATDTLVFALLILTIFLSIFFVTALFGRIWCGWGCPQTVYMELVYRPIERLFEGRHYTSGGRVPVNPARMAAKYVVFLFVSLVLAHTFLAYFVGVDRLFDWMRQSPFEHPSAFIIVVAVTGLMMFDFAYFREQVCTLMCPYGRIQSALLDRQSLIITYDPKRGEPRGRRRRGQSFDDRGDCVDCGLCVATCPTGIDIRAGLQMECIGCAQCIDACDAVMEKVKRPKGLIRFSSQAAIEGEHTRLLRARVVVYPLLLAVAAGLFGMALAGQTSADVSFLRTRSTPYRTLDSGAVSNVVTVRLTNRSDEARTYRIETEEALEVTSPDMPLTIEPGKTATATLHVVVARERFARGRAEIGLRISDDVDFDETFERPMIGPLYGGSP